MQQRKIDGIRFYVLVIVVGIIAGLGAIVFRDLIAFFHNILFYGQFSTQYDVLRHALPSRWGAGIIVVPVIGAGIVAFLVKHYAPEAKGHGVPEVMDAIYYEHGIVRPIVALVKAVASSISIGSGGSVGREGPIIQIGAAFGSALGQWITIPNWQRITLIACGAGGGIAATFNAPFGGILFAIEIMLPEISIRTLIPVSLATAIATYVSYLAFGNVSFIPFVTAAATQLSVVNSLHFLVFGLLFGIASVVFIRSIYFAEDVFDMVFKNEYLRHMTGMLLVGFNIYAMMYFYGHYYVQGVGYATIVDVLSELLTHPGFLLLLAALKLLDTALTLGSGGSGGVFSPLLFIGATFGACIVIGLQILTPNQVALTVQFGALAGMAAMVGASTGAMMTAIIMTAEMTADFTIVLPLMIIVAIANGVRRLIMRDTIYTLKLTRRGHIVPDVLEVHPHVMT